MHELRHGRASDDRTSMGWFGMNLHASDGTPIEPAGQAFVPVVLAAANSNLGWGWGF
jgi:hypothetical protein